MKEPLGSPSLPPATAEPEAITADTWNNVIKPSLTGEAKWYVFAHFVTSTTSTLTLSVPSESSFSARCEEARETLETALRGITGREVAVELTEGAVQVVEDASTGRPDSRGPDDFPLPITLTTWRTTVQPSLGDDEVLSPFAHASFVASTASTTSLPSTLTLGFESSYFLSRAFKALSAFESRLLETTGAKVYVKLSDLTEGPTEMVRADEIRPGDTVRVGGLSHSGQRVVKVRTRRGQTRISVQNPLDSSAKMTQDLWYRSEEWIWRNIH